MKNKAIQRGEKFAVITGASTGIGFELAKQFAKNGYDLLIASRSDKIFDAAKKLTKTGVNVETAQVDLATNQGVKDLYQKMVTIGRPIDAIAINAGVGIGGSSFDKSSLKREMELLRLNVISVVHLAKLVVKHMVKRGEGKILFTSSVASLMPGPYETVYSASKAFVQSFAEGLRQENKDKGITITSLMPGPTETNFFHRAGMDDTAVADQKKADPRDVAKMGFEALMKGEDSVIAGDMMMRVQANLAKVMPQPMAAKMHERMTRPNSPANR